MYLTPLIRAIHRRVRTALEVRKYTPTTIADYLRRFGATIGEGCFIVPTNLGTEPYLVKIGNHVAIADGVLFMTHDSGAWVLRDLVPDLQVFGPIVIEDNCLIGQRAILGPNIRIGPNSIVAAGSVVLSDVPPNTLVMGVPARPFGSIDRYRDKCLQRWVDQRPPGVQLAENETWWEARSYSENRDRMRKHLLALFHDQLNGGSEQEPGSK